MSKTSWTDGDRITATELNRMEDHGVIIVADAASRPTGVEGQTIFQADIAAWITYDGSNWGNRVDLGWTAYTPSWSNLGQGNGTYGACQFKYVGGAIRQTGSLTFGSTTAATMSGSQVLQDVADSNTAGGVGLGLVRLGAGGTAYQAGQASIDDGQTAWRFYCSDGSGIVDSAAPATWTTGDTLWWDLTCPLDFTDGL